MEFLFYFVIGFLVVSLLTGKHNHSFEQEMRNCKKCKQHTVHLRNINQSGFFHHIFTLGISLIREVYRDYSGYYDYRCERCGTTNRKFFDFLRS